MRHVWHAACVIDTSKITGMPMQVLVMPDGQTGAFALRNAISGRSPKRPGIEVSICFELQNDWATVVRSGSQFMQALRTVIKITMARFKGISQMNRNMSQGMPTMRLRNGNIEA